jgi:AraC family transcriptional regulator
MTAPVQRSTQPDCLQVYYHRRERADARSAHRHTGHQVTVTVGGLADVRWWSASRGSRRVQAVDGQIMVNPAGEPHATEWTGSWERVGFHLDAGFIRRIAAELGVSDAAGVRAEADARDVAVHNLALTLREQIAEDPLSCRLYAETIAQLLAIRLLKAATPAAPTPTRRSPRPLPHHMMRAVADFVAGHLDRNLSVTEIAQVAGMSPFHFARRFKALNGITPYHYVTRVRVYRACDLLRDPVIPITEICYRVGFSSQSHLSAHFSRIVGTTPARYRRNL